MARIVVGAYMVRYPLGGMLSFSLQWLVGFQRLGHDVYFVEKSGWSNSCYDPINNVMSDECAYGVKVVRELLTRFGLGDHWCYVDAAAQYHGLSRPAVDELFRTADLFVDIGTHGSWMEEAGKSKRRAFIDGEPGFRQMKMENSLAAAEQLAEYDYYFTVGRNIGTPRSAAPIAGRNWRPTFHPVVVDLFTPRPLQADAPFTTVMNWQSYEPVCYRGETYGHKDVEFEKFIDLPTQTKCGMEVAISGKNAPLERIRQAGWRVRNAHSVTASVDSFWEYIASSRAEFSVAKSGFVRTNSGWFSERASTYLASGRPVVQQDTGFGHDLPCGEGLMAVQTLEEAAFAIEEICGNYPRHSRRAREIAVEYVSARKVLGGLLDEIGL